MSNPQGKVIVPANTNPWPHEQRNIIIDTSRMKNVRDNNTQNFLINQARVRKQIKKLIMITKQGQIIDISALA